MAITNKNLLLKNILPNSFGGRGLYKQKGVVLIVSLVFLVALTGVAAALMQNTTSDMKMTGASNEKVIATQGAISAVDEVIDNQVNIQAISVFTQGLNNLPLLANGALLPATTKTKASATARAIQNPLFEEFDCPRSNNSSSVGIIECNYIELTVQRPYGINNTSNIVINANIAQELLPSY